MDINQIRYFLNLAQTLSFTEAARMSGVAQPSLTRSIQKLEEELGGLLLYRDGKDTRLTALGRDVQIEFMRVQSSLEAVASLAENTVVGRNRKLTVGVARTVSPAATAPLWQRVLGQLPTIELRFQTLQDDEGEMEILSGKFDLAILAREPAPNFKLAIVPLYEEPLRLALPAGHPLASQTTISPKQLSELPYLERLNCEFRTALTKQLMDKNVVMRPRLQSDREDWIQRMVAEGAGVCALPAHSVIVEGIVLRPIVGINLSRRVALVGVSGSGTPKEVRQILTIAARPR